ncbi:hypothetical protein V5799_013980 [Amblyomma americanum]|uniref:Uncharacterized protein n=1 Tax=Amblyomma americanum TaxID=6943 RepID=A0AAQ4E4D2_AMBAM
MDASVCSDILELSASFDKRVAIVHQLLDQNRRLLDVAVSEETYQLRVDDILSSVSRLRDILASEHERCKSIIAVATNAGHCDGAAAAAAPPEEARSVLPIDYGAALEERCRKLLTAARANVDAIERMEERQAAMHSRAKSLAVRITQDCQGSPETWCKDMRAGMDDERERSMILCELFKEFHNNPTRFAARMKSAVKRRGAVGERQETEDQK